MANHVQPFRNQHSNNGLALRTNLFKFFKSLSNSHDEEQRQLNYIDDLSKRISASEQQTTSISAEVTQVKEEKAKIIQKNAELNVKLEREIRKAENLQSEIERDRASK